MYYKKDMKKYQRLLANRPADEIEFLFNKLSILHFCLVETHKLHETNF